MTSLPAIVRTGTLVPADQKMRPYECTFRPLPGAEIRLEGRSFSGAREMYCRRVYFREDGYEPLPGDVTVDLGANEGLFSVLAAVRGGTAYAVEAQSGFLPLIAANLARNACSGSVKTELALVGGGSGLLSRGDRQAASHWGDEPARLTLADVVHRAGSVVNLMKIDIEGSEFDLFSGDLSCLSRVERIVMEVHPEFGDATEMQRALERLRFRTVLRDSEGRYVRTGRRLTYRGGYLFATRMSN